jgi:hypothetical protein
MEDQQAVLLGYRNVKVVSKQVSMQRCSIVPGGQDVLACSR